MPQIQWTPPTVDECSLVCFSRQIIWTVSHRDTLGADHKRCRCSKQQRAVQSRNQTEIHLVRGKAKFLLLRLRFPFTGLYLSTWVQGEKNLFSSLTKHAQVQLFFFPVVVAEF